jgi:hypothetical protein
MAVAMSYTNRTAMQPARGDLVPMASQAGLDRDAVARMVGFHGAAL